MEVNRFIFFFLKIWLSIYHDKFLFDYKLIISNFVEVILIYEWSEWSIGFAMMFVYFFPELLFHVINSVQKFLYRSYTTFSVSFKQVIFLQLQMFYQYLKKITVKAVKITINVICIINKSLVSQDFFYNHFKLEFPRKIINIHI